MDKKDKIKFNVLAIICIIVFAFSITPKTLQNDTFYTISTGEYIVENGVDRTDHFSWADLKYTYPHWAYDALMYLVYDAGGMTGIYLSTVILSCILGIMIYVTNNKINKNSLFSFILALGCMCLLRSFVAARAQLVTFILFVTEILFIECFIETKKKRYAIRFNGYCMAYCEPTCCSILRFLYILFTIYCGIFNYENKGSALST